MLSLLIAFWLLRDEVQGGRLYANDAPVLRLCPMSSVTKRQRRTRDSRLTALRIDYSRGGVASRKVLQEQQSPLRPICIQ